jgi:hypothetical protein
MWVGNNPVSGTDPTGGFTDFKNMETGEVHHVEDGFTATIDVSSELFNSIKAGNFGTVKLANQDYLKLLFSAVSVDISRNNDLGLYQKYRDVYGSNFFWQGLNASYSDEHVQNSALAPTARSVAGNFTDVNLALKAVLWRDGVLAPNGLDNSNQHQMATSILTAKAGIFGAFGITSGNEILNLRRDAGTGNLRNAIMGRPANNGGTTAFEWSDIGNNLKGIWRSWTGF